MERFTVRDEYGYPFAKWNKTYEVIKKLAEYEDLEEQGLLLRLPCRVEDEVWYICTHNNSIALERWKIYRAIVTKVCVMGIGTCVVIQIHDNYGVTEIPTIDCFGKTVFLTKAEAEEALQKMQEGGE